MNHLDALHDIHTFIFDVDGVLTNGEILITEDGQLLRKMNTRDGYAMKYAIDKGYNIMIITGGKSEGVVSRLKGLGIKEIYSGVKDKQRVLEELSVLHELDLGRVLYMGDDIPDLQPMRRVGIAACPHDAAEEILNICHFISNYKGGEGCVRDIIEKVMKLQGTWNLEGEAV